MTELAESLAGPLASAPASSEHPLEHPLEHRLERPDERIRVYVWQVPVRFTHWLTALCIVVLSLTGLYIADPFLVPAGGSSMGTIRMVHIVAAFALLLSGTIRTIWLIQGNRFARWTAFIPLNRRQATELFRQAGFYGFLRRELPKILGHNQLAATAYIVLFGLLAVEVVTGFALDGVLGSAPSAALFGWLWELLGPQTLRVIHHLAMWLILCIALFHIYSCVLVDGLEKNGLLASIFSGYKFPTREEVVEARDGGPDVLAEAEAAEGAWAIGHHAIEGHGEPSAAPVATGAMEAIPEAGTEAPTGAMAEAMAESAAEAPTPAAEVLP